jgi:hypothetical protein
MFIYLFIVEYPGEGLDGEAPPCDPIAPCNHSVLIALPPVTQVD